VWCLFPTGVIWRQVQTDREDLKADDAGATCRCDVVTKQFNVKTNQCKTISSRWDTSSKQLVHQEEDAMETLA
jgi:hypothetical protein